MTLTIFLADGTYAEVQDFKYATGSNSDTKREGKDVTTMRLGENITYSFVGSNTSVTLTGANIKYVRLDS